MTKIIRFEDEGAKVWHKRNSRSHIQYANRGQLRANHVDKITYICGDNENIIVDKIGNIIIKRESNVRKPITNQPTVRKRFIKYLRDTDKFKEI